MSGDNYLVIFEFFKAFDELHADIVCLLRRYVFADLEGLNEMIEANAVRLVAVYLLRGKEGLVRQLRDAIVSRDIGELFVLVESFLGLHTVIKHAFLCAGCLILFGNTFNNCHRFHLRVREEFDDRETTIPRDRPQRSCPDGRAL